MVRGRDDSDDAESGRATGGGLDFARREETVRHHARDEIETPDIDKLPVRDDTARYCLPQLALQRSVVRARTWMANLYHLPRLPDPGKATLTGAVAHHLLRVLRLAPGDALELSDGQGRSARATVCEARRRDLLVEVDAPVIRARTRPEIVLAFACPRPARADWLIEHGTELGVAAFQPISTERSTPNSVRTARWRKLASAAAGQCARYHLPEIREPLALAAFLGSSLPADRVLADLDGAPPCRRNPTDPVAILVGPEGGFSPAEHTMAVERGFVATTFGPHILRTETAALVSAAVLMQATQAGARVEP